MDRFRLKNVIILILLLLNTALLASLSLRRSAESNAFRRTEDQLVQLFHADGISLQPGAISNTLPPDGVSLSRDTNLEARAAAFLLGQTPDAFDQGGGIYHYRSENGDALFRSSGGFDASGTLSHDPEDFCRRFCRTFSYDIPDFQLDSSNSGLVTAVFQYGRIPVLNGTVTFTVENGVLTAVSGVLLPESGTLLASEETPLSAAGALIAFQKMRRENTVGASAITDTRLCYELQISGSAMSLTPVWRIVTDTEDYCVNCFTGAVTAAGGVPESAL